MPRAATGKALQRLSGPRPWQEVLSRPGQFRLDLTPCTSAEWQNPTGFNAGALFGQSLKDTTRLGYISPEPARLNGNTFTASSLPSAAARRCADHASSAARFSSAQSCL